MKVILRVEICREKLRLLIRMGECMKVRLWWIHRLDNIILMVVAPSFTAMAPSTKEASKTVNSKEKESLLPKMVTSKMDNTKTECCF